MQINPKYNVGDTVYTTSNTGDIVKLEVSSVTIVVGKTITDITYKLLTTSKSNYGTIKEDKLYASPKEIAKVWLSRNGLDVNDL